MSAPDKTSLIDHVAAVERQLREEPPSPEVTQALHQAERLKQAIQQAHAEGLRFAAYTLNRLMQHPGANWRASTRAAAAALKDALASAGYTH